MFRGIGFLLRYTWKSEKAYILTQMLLQIIVAATPLVDIIIPKYIIDELTGSSRVEVLVGWIGLLIGANLTGNWLISFLSGKAFLLKGRLFTHFQAMLAEQLSKCDFQCLEDPKFLDTRSKAEKFLYANGQGFGAVMDSAFDILGQSLTFIGVIAVICTLNIWIVVGFILVILLNAFYESKVRERYARWDLEKAPIERKTSYFIDLVGNFAFGKEIRLYRLREWIVSKIKEHLLESERFYTRQTRLLNRARYISGFADTGLKGAAYGYLAYSVWTGSIGLGSFTMYISALLNFSNNMKGLLDSIIDIRQFGGYYNALQEYMNVPQTMYKGRQDLPAGPYEIAFENVSFRYPGQDVFALQNISLKLRSGEKLSIVGENGAGKTTFVKLLCRLYDPTEGKITLNGIDIRTIRYDEYMKLVGSVFQDYKLLAFTLKENVAFQYAETEEDQRIQEILIQSGLGSRLSTLRKGVQTNVYRTFEEDGFEPSGGEGQKIALARAIYKDAPVMVLDEPTAALDPRAEYEIYQNFSKLTEGKTTVFISHRMSSSKFCDRIALFAQGKIIEYGTHEELMTQDGAYRELFEMQAQFYL
mgnify:CR=1 FL=1